MTSTLLGYSESHKLSVRVEQLELFLRFITSTQTEIRYAAMPVEEIVLKHNEDMRFLHLCSEYCKNGSNFLQAWDAAATNGTKGLGLNSKDISLIRDFGAEFGASDIDGQLAHCKLYIQLILARLENAREEKSKKSKLYLMLGVFFGLAVALLLC